MKKDPAYNLLTPEIIEALEKQYDPTGEGSLDNVEVVAKYFHPFSTWYWYAIDRDPRDPDRIFGIVSGMEVELGYFSIAELEGLKIHGLGIERDLHFAPRNAREVLNTLKAGEHV